MTMEPLETARLHLRPIGAEDFEAVHDVYTDPEVMRFHSDGPFDAAKTRAWLERTLSRYDGGELGFRAVIHRKTGDYVGHMRLQREVTWRARAHFLYSIERAVWENLPRTDSQ